MPKIRRRPADREPFWRDTIATWKGSGPSIWAFCAARGIAEATFFVKRRELARRGPHAEPVIEVSLPKVRGQ